MIRFTPAPRSLLAVGLAAATLLTLAACTKKPAPPPADTTAAAPAPPPQPLAVGIIDLGKAIGPDQTISAPLTTFGVGDTIYASVRTTGVGSNATVAAKWTFVKADGSETAVNETSQTISPTGPATTEFHISKASAWPRGKYKVEILLNGVSAGTKEFEVK